MPFERPFRRQTAGLKLYISVFKYHFGYSNNVLRLLVFRPHIFGSIPRLKRNSIYQESYLIHAPELPCRQKHRLHRK